MKHSPQNKYHPTDTCIELFEKALSTLTASVREIDQSSQFENNIFGFAYGFGFNNPITLLSKPKSASVRSLFPQKSDDPTISLAELTQNWKRHKRTISRLASDMSGVSPMLEGLNTIDHAFKKATSLKLYGSKILIILSDGKSSDANNAEIRNKVYTLKANNITVITLYVSDEKTLIPQLIYSYPDPTWKQSTQLMYDCASSMSSSTFLFSYLKEHGWRVPSHGKLFTQVDKTDFKKYLSNNKQEEPPKNINFAQDKDDIVFICHSEKDIDWLNKLKLQIKQPLEHKASIQFWSDKNLTSDQEWDYAAEKTLLRSQAVVLLISPDFLSSGFMQNNRLTVLLERAKQRGTYIIPLILKPSRFQYETSLRSYKGINSANNPLSALPESDQVKIIQQLISVIEKSLKEKRNKW